MYQKIISKLGLEPLPAEGGFYKETYRCEDSFTWERSDKSVVRNFSTAIYYLVTPTSFSALHKVKQDEIFHFYAGSPVEMVQIHENGTLEKIIIGNDILNDQVPQVVVKAGVWQGTKLLNDDGWALMGTTVSPGFDFADFELKGREILLKMFPQHKDIVTRYTHE